MSSSQGSQILGVSGFKKRLFLVAGIIYFLFPSSSHADEGISKYGTYEVQVGDTLSEVLMRFSIKPLYGKNGSVKKFAQLNSAAVKSQGDLIHPGAKILLPISSELLSEEMAAQKPFLPTVTPPRQPATETKNCVAGVPEEKRNPPASADSQVEVSALLDYSALFGTDRATGTSARLISKPSLGERVTWIQNWDESNSTNIFLEHTQRLLESTNTGTYLANSNQALTSFGGGYRKKISHLWSAGFDLAYSESTFYHGNAGANGGLALNALPLLQLHPQFQFLVLERDPLSLNLQGGLSYFGATSYDNYTVESGFGYDVAVLLQHKFMASSMQCQAFYEERRQNTSLIYLLEKNLGGRCGYLWRFR
jgi:hypothetical protein